MRTQSSLKTVLILFVVAYTARTAIQAWRSRSSPLAAYTAVAAGHGFALLALSFSLLARLRWHPAFVLVIGAAAGSLGLLP